ncbi:11247_t:CDS:1, partial [Cetraspora pellucida]
INLYNKLFDQENTLNLKIISDYKFEELSLVLINNEFDVDNESDE